MTKLPPPPPMTSDEIVGHIRRHWLENLGATEIEADLRAEKGFLHLLTTGAIREWGFTKDGWALYEPHAPVVSEAIVFVLLNKEDD